MQAYGIANVIVQVDAVTLSGFAEGDDCFDIKKTKDDVQTEMSADGTQMAVSLDPDFSGEISIKLQWSSPSNAILMAMYKAQRLAARGAGVLVAHTVRVMDAQRRDLDTLSPCVIKKAPDRTRGGKAAPLVWTFVGAQLDSEQGPGIPVLTMG